MLPIYSIHENIQGAPTHNSKDIALKFCTFIALITSNVALKFLSNKINYKTTAGD